MMDCSRLENSQNKWECFNRFYFCKYCHNGFGTKEFLVPQLGRMEIEGQQEEMPSPDEELKLKNRFQNLRYPFVYKPPLNVQLQN